MLSRIRPNAAVVGIVIVGLASIITAPPGASAAGCRDGGLTGDSYGPTSVPGDAPYPVQVWFKRLTPVDNDCRESNTLTVDGSEVPSHAAADSIYYAVIHDAAADEFLSGVHLAVATITEGDGFSACFSWTFQVGIEVLASTPVLCDTSGLAASPPDPTALIPGGDPECALGCTFEYRDLGQTAFPCAASLCFYHHSIRVQALGWTVLPVMTCKGTQNGQWTYSDTGVGGCTINMGFTQVFGPCGGSESWAVSANALLLPHSKDASGAVWVGC